MFNDTCFIHVDNVYMEKKVILHLIFKYKNKIEHTHTRSFNGFLGTTNVWGEYLLHV